MGWRKREGDQTRKKSDSPCQNSQSDSQIHSWTDVTNPFHFIHMLLDLAAPWSSGGQSSIIRHFFDCSRPGRQNQPLTGVWTLWVYGYATPEKQHTATHCNTLQHTATHYNTRQHLQTPHRIRSVGASTAPPVELEWRNHTPKMFSHQ